MQYEKTVSNEEIPLNKYLKIQYNTNFIDTP